MTLPSEPPVSPELRNIPVPAQLISYASGDTIAGATTGVRVLLGLLAAAHLLLGAPTIIWACVRLISILTGSYVDEGEIIWMFISVVVAAVDVAIGVWLIVRRPWTWRAAHVALAALSTLSLIGCGFGVGLVIAYKGATGWDGLALAIGVFLFAIASALFWLHALSKLALLRLKVRRAFLMGDDERHRLHRIGTFVMMSLYALMVLVGVVWFVLK
jgi:hypothetical protein